MAMRVRIKMNSKGAREILKSKGVGADLLARGYRVQGAAGPGKYIVSIHYGRNRARVSVITADNDARKAEAESRALTRALDAARG